MGRPVTKNAQGELEVEETFSFAGSNPTLGSVKLIAKDGNAVDKENPSWLGFTQSASGSDLTATLRINATGGVETYTTYTFEIEATDDTGNEKSRRVNVGVGSLATRFEFETIAGNEDVVRSDEDGRIEIPGRARVVAQATMPSTIDVHYVINPVDEDDPSFQRVEKSVSSGKQAHEVFFSVFPSSLIAFEVTARADNDESVPDIRSSTYYFRTGEEILSGFEVAFGAESSLETRPGPGEILVIQVESSLFTSLSTSRKRQGDSTIQAISSEVETRPGVAVEESLKAGGAGGLGGRVDRP